MLDAFAVIEWLLQTPTGGRVEQRSFSAVPSLRAPHLLDIEVTQVLWRYVAARHMTAIRAEEEDLLDLPLTRYPHDWLLWRIWDLRRALTAYGAAYVALAEVLGAPLITCDREDGLGAWPLRRHRVDVDFLALNENLVKCSFYAAF